MKTMANDRRRLFYLVLIMALVALSVGIVSVGILYNTAIEQQKARLVEITQSQARLIEAIAHHEDAKLTPQETFDHTLSQIREAHENYVGFGETGEFTLARREGDDIVFLLSHRHFDLGNPRPVPFATDLAEPQRRALSGESGTVIGLDYRGETVLAAYEPVAELGLGIVAKIDMAEIQAPFYRAAFYTLMIAATIIFFGAIAFLRVSSPMIEHLEESVEALRVSEERFQLTLNNSPITVFNHDSELRYTWIYNPHPSLKPENMVGKTDADLFPPKDAARLMAIKTKVLKSGEAAHTEIKMTLGGKRHHYELKVEPLTDLDGNCFGLTCISWDISARKQAEEKIKRLNEELEQRVIERTAQLESFSYSVSHDLRAPLRAINGFSQVLEEDYANLLGTEGIEYLEKIKKSSTRMDRLINDLLNLSLLGRQELKLEPLDLTEMACEVFEALQANEPDRAIDFRIQIPEPDCMAIQADRNQFEIILTNLLTNAVKFSRNANPAVIEFGCLDEADENVYFIRDNGVGFNMEYGNKLFIPFQRLHSESEFEGMGIGLATVQQIIQRHSGQIWVEAEVDKGATFYFTIGRASNHKALDL